MIESRSLASSLFEVDHPLSSLLKTYRARMVVNPRSLVEDVGSELTALGEIVAFVNSTKGRSLLVPVQLGEMQNIIGVVPVKGGEVGVKKLTLDSGSLAHQTNRLEEGENKQECGIVLATLDTIRELALGKPEPKSKLKRKRKEKWLHPYQSEIELALNISAKKIGRKVGVKAEKLENGGVLLMFVDQSNAREQLCDLIMPNVIRWGKRMNKLTESKKAREVMGVYIPGTSDQDPGLIERKLMVLTRKVLSRRKGTMRQKPMIMSADKKLTIAAATERQMNIWKREGFFTEIKAYREGAASLRETINLLRRVLGDQVNLHIHHLSDGKIDIVFVPKKPTVLGELSLHNMIGVMNGKEEIVENVAGVICTEDRLVGSERKNLSSQARARLRLIQAGKLAQGRLPNVLSVNRELLKIWKKKLRHGETISWPVEREGPGSAYKIHKVEGKQELMNGDIDDVEFFMYEPGPSAIGARVMQLIVKYVDGNEERLTLDMGAQYEDFPWQGLAKPSFEMGIAPFRNQIPFIPKFVRRTLLVKEAQSRKAAFLGDVADPYLRDLYHRLGQQDFGKVMAAYAPHLDAGEIMRQLAEMSNFDNIHQIGIAISHFHADHDGWLGVPATRIPQIFATEGLPFFETKFLSGAAGYMSEGPFRRERQSLFTQGSREVVSPPIANPEPYIEMRIGSGRIGITMLPVSHSIYGAVMYKITVYDQFDNPVVKMAYSGDYNFDNLGLTERAFEEIRDVEVFVTDTTNINPSMTKPSLLVTEEMMAQSFDGLFKNKSGLSVVGLNWNNVRDVSLITELARSRGKDVFVGPKLATLLHLFLEMDEGMTQQNHSFNWRAIDPVPRLGFGIYPYMPLKSPKTRTKADRILESAYGLIEPADLSSHGMGDSVVIVPTNPNFAHVLGGIDTSKIAQLIWSTYWPYGPQDKMIVRENFKFASQKQIPFYSDLVISANGNILPSQTPRHHRSGHAKQGEVLARIKMLHQEGQLRMVIPVHGPARQYAAQLMKKEAGDSLRVVERMGKGGWRVSLLGK